MHDATHTRRRLLRTGATATLAAVGVTGTAAAGNRGGNKGDGNEGKGFGRVWANGTLFRTNVVRVLDEEPDPGDVIYFVNDGTTASLPGGGGTANANSSPFVSESAPGDADWNGGQWIHVAATLADGVTLDEPLTSEADVAAAAEAGELTLSVGRPTLDGTDQQFGPPAFFVCPLNGRA